MAEENKTSKIVFMGTPEFAADILRQLIQIPQFLIESVFTQPDKPAGRGKRLMQSPVKIFALEHGLPVFQPKTLKNEQVRCQLAAVSPDFLVVAAYGMLLPSSVLSIPHYASVNVHTSLLPSYRGCAPVQRAILDGLDKSGVSIMRMDEGLDTGPIFAQEVVDIHGETTGSVLKKMSSVAGPLLVQVLFDLLSGKQHERFQADVITPYAEKISSSDGIIDWTESVHRTECRIRAVTPSPGAHTVLVLDEHGEIPVVLESVNLDPSDEIYSPGSIIARKGEMRISCKDGNILVQRLKPFGKKSMDASAFLNGFRFNSRVPVCIGHARG